MPINSFLYPAPSTPSFAYEVANSLRLDEPSNQGLTKTPSGAGNRRTFTLSTWVKRSKITNETGDVQTMFESRESNNDNCALTFQTDDTLSIKLKVSGTNKSLITNRVFRDVSAWYHIVCAVDTTQSTDSNRVKIYVNGVQETSFGTEDYPSQDAQTSFNNSVGHGIGKRSDTTSQNFDGYLTEVVMIDGSALAPTSFGEFDSDTPNVWKPIDISGLTFGTNGFYLDFEDSSALGNDVSGNNNDYSVSNLSAVDQSTDTCTNNFATLNSLFATQDSGVISKGNTIYTASANAWGGSGSTIGLSQGKWYFEAQINDNAGGHFFGVIDETANVNNNPHQRTGSTFYYSGSGGQMYKDGSGSGSYGTFGASDIAGVALNLDDDEITIYKNGSAIVTDFALSTTKNTLFVWVMGYNSGSDLVKVNFGGTPPFSISSGNSDANGYGNFEYSVPSGYYSINTKNLAEYG